MDQPGPLKKSGFLKWVAVAVIAILVVSIAAYLLLARAPPNSELQGTENGVTQNVGTEYPRMIDIASAELNAKGTTLTVSINVRSPISVLGTGEDAQWNVTVTLENNDTVLKTYEIGVDMNGTQLSSLITDVDLLNSSACQAEYHGNTLTTTASMKELPTATKAEWSVLTSYEKYSGGDLVDSAYDMAPEEGLQTTTLRK